MRIFTRLLQLLLPLYHIFGVFLRKSAARIVLMFVVTFAITTLVTYPAQAISLTQPLGKTAPATKPDDNGADVVDRVKDSYGRDTPRGTVQGFMKALANNDDTMAARYLNIPANKNAGDAVRQFKQALDSGGKFAPDLQISNDPEGNLSDNLPTDIDKVGTINEINPITGKSGDIDILLEKVKSKDADGQDTWLFSQKTLQKIPASSPAKTTWVENYMPKTWLNMEFHGYNLGQVVAMGAFALYSLAVCLLISWLLFIIFRIIYRLIYKHHEMPIDSRVILPLGVLGAAILVKELMLAAGISVVVRELANRGADILGWVSAVWLLVRITDTLFRRAEHLSINSTRPERLSILSLLRKVVKAVLLILAVIFILGNLGFDLTTGIAALGVGGLALALGAQKTVENLVGSIVVVADQPVSVGDYCKFGKHEGTVEDIGIRSTRVRTPNRTLLTIPNGEFSAMQIENFTARDMYQFQHLFYLTRDTHTGKMRGLLDQLQTYITKHKDVTDFINQVRIAGMQQDAYTIEVRCYLIAESVLDFYDKQTQMIMDIADIIEKSGLKYALPTQQLVVQNLENEKNIFPEAKSLADKK